MTKRLGPMRKVVHREYVKPKYTSGLTAILYLACGHTVHRKKSKAAKIHRVHCPECLLQEMVDESR